MYPLMKEDTLRAGVATRQSIPLEDDDYYLFILITHLII